MSGTDSREGALRDAVSLGDLKRDNAEIAKGVRSRDDRRRRAIRDLLRRITKGRTATPRARGQNLAADVLCAVISFETYDALAAAGHSREEIAVTITDLAECAVRTLQ